MSTKVKNKLEKRKFISKEDAHEILSEYYQELFRAYYSGIDKYNMEIQQTIPEARTRLDSTLLNAKLTESFILNFPDNWGRGKYGRIIFRWENIQMLIKKLDKNNKPSYIPTLLSGAIQEQLQLSLFEDGSADQDAILIFGYTKDKYGQIVNPRIVYFDGEAKWIIYSDEISMPKPAEAHKQIEEIAVTLKKEEKRKAE